MAITNEIAIYGPRISFGNKNNLNLTECDRGLIFWDIFDGFGFWDGTTWIFGNTPGGNPFDEITLPLQTFDFKFDVTDPNDPSLYIEFNKEVIGAILNGKTFDFHQDFTHTPFRIYGFGNNAPQTLILTHKR